MILLKKYYNITFFGIFLTEQRLGVVDYSTMVSRCSFQLAALFVLIDFSYNNFFIFFFFRVYVCVCVFIYEGDV